MTERHHVLVTAMTFGAPTSRSERLIFNENEVAADDFGGTTVRTLKGLRDARYSQRSEKGLPSLVPLDDDLPIISFDITRAPPWSRDLTIDMADLLVQGMGDVRRVHLGQEHEGLDPDIRRTCLGRIARAVADGLFDPNGEDHAATTAMRQLWTDPDLELAVDPPNAWSSPALNVMDGFHVMSTIALPIEPVETRSMTIHVDGFESTERAGRTLWTVMPTRIFFREEEVPQGLDLLRILAEADR